MQNNFLRSLRLIRTRRGKTVLSFFLVLVGYCQLVVAQNTGKSTYLLSQRVGLEIDSIEAEYFNIFPELDAVKSAVYRQDNFGNLQMLISLASGKDTTLSFSKLASEELGKYIDKHEILVDSSNIVNWDLLPGYNLNRINYFEDHGTLVEIRTDSGFYSGKLMMVTDTSLLLWATQQPFRPDTWSKYSKKVMVRDIVRIERKQDMTGKIFGISIGAGIGAALLHVGFDLFGSEELSTESSILLVAGGGLVGAFLGTFYDEITISRRIYKIRKNYDNFRKLRPRLEKRAIFQKIYPPELRNI